LRLDAPTLDLAPFATGPTSPPPRSGATLIDDGARARLLLFGGSDAAGMLGDTWELSVTP
jgi:hypothetical protein